MGSWSNASYVNHGDLDAVERALTEMFAAEGMQPIPRPPENKEHEFHSPMQYRRAAENDLWAVALLPGREGWTIIRTAPFNLLCERAAGANRIRLASLTASLGCQALVYNLHDSTEGLLIEALPTGEYALSGFIPNPEPRGASMDYYDEPYGGDDNCQEYFRLLDAHDIARPEASDGNRRVIQAMANNPYPSIQQWPDHEEITLAIADALGGPNAEEGDNRIMVNVLIQNKPMDIPGGRSLYYVRA